MAINISSKWVTTYTQSWTIENKTNIDEAASDSLQNREGLWKKAIKFYMCIILLKPASLNSTITHVLLSDKTSLQFQLRPWKKSTIILNCQFRNIEVSHLSSIKSQGEIKTKIFDYY